MAYILDLPAELLNVIFTDSELSQEILKRLRPICKSFNNAIVPILFSHVIIDLHRDITCTTAQITQLAGSLGSESIYGAARTLEIRPVKDHGWGNRYGVDHVQAVSALADVGLSAALRALVGLQSVKWIISRADPVACIDAIVGGLCMLPLGSDLNVRIEYRADELHAALVRLGPRLKSLCVNVAGMGNFLVVQRPRDLELMAALVAGSPRLERLEFRRRYHSERIPDPDLGTVFSKVPPDRACLLHLTVENFFLQLGDAAHELRALQSFTLLAGSLSPSNAGLISLWDTLVVARVFPPILSVLRENDAFIDYLSQHPGLTGLSVLNGWLQADFLDRVLPRHAGTLKNLMLKVNEWNPTLPLLPLRPIAQCYALEMLALDLVWYDKYFDELLVLLSAISGLQRLTLTIYPGTDEYMWDTMMTQTACVLDDEALRAPAEILINRRLFRLENVKGTRRYTHSGSVPEVKVQLPARSPIRSADFLEI